MANWLHVFPPVDALVADFVFSEWRPEVIRRVVKYLDPANVRVTVLSKKCRYFTTQVRPKPSFCVIFPVLIVEVFPFC